MKHGIILNLMSQFFIILFVLFCLTGCPSVSDNDSERQNKNSKRRSLDEYTDRHDDDFKDDFSDDDFSGDDFSGDDLGKKNVKKDNSVFTSATDSQTPLDGQGSTVVSIEPLNQKGISNKIDFLFIIDSSPENSLYISPPQLENKIGLLPIQLNNLNIDWRFFFINAEFKTGSKSGRNGKLMNLEYNEALIRSQYLDNDVASFVDNKVSGIFIDTIEKNSKKCDLPPYCHSKKNNRPLKVFHNFLLESQFILRQDADLFAIILTNRDEVQPSKSSKSDKAVEAQQVIDRFTSIFPNKKFYVTSIIVKAGDTICKEQNRHNIFASYIPQLSQLTRGMTINICSIQDNGYSAPIINWITKMKNPASS